MSQPLSLTRRGFVAVGLAATAPLPLTARRTPAAENKYPAPGVVLDYVPAKTKMYVGSPAIAVLPDGGYVASHDFFGPGSQYNRTAVFRSDDAGETWRKLTEFRGQWWSNLFVHQGDLYIFGTSERYGRIVIRRSTDGGRTWTEPKDASSGRLTEKAGYHCAPMPIKIHNGRIWRAFEDNRGGNGWGKHFRSIMLSAPVDADLLHAESWRLTNPIAREADWLDGTFGGWLEGNAVITPDGGMANILRVHNPPAGAKAAIINISDDGREANFNPETGFIDFPGGNKKFTIRYDPRTEHYWSLANYIPPVHNNSNPGGTRNTLALIRSQNLRDWDVRCILIHHPDRERHGYQYPDWLFDGDDMIAAIRTAHDQPDGGQAHNAHDANYLTFHRFRNFRELTLDDSVVPPKKLGMT